MHIYQEHSTDIFAELVALGTAFSNAGILPIFATTTIARGGPNGPNGGYNEISYADLDAKQAALNQLIRTNQTSLKAAGVVDLATDYRLRSYTVQYQYDGIHETIQGQEVVAKMTSQGLLAAAAGQRGFIIPGQDGPIGVVVDDDNQYIQFGSAPDWVPQRFSNQAGGLQISCKGPEAYIYYPRPFQANRIELTMLQRPDGGEVEVLVDEQVIGTFNTKGVAQYQKRFTFTIPGIGLQHASFRLRAAPGFGPEEFIYFDEARAYVQ